MKMKKLLSVLTAALVFSMLFTGCGDKNKKPDNNSKAFQTDKDITAVVREEGSGTRNIFAQLFHLVREGAEDLADLTFEGAKIKERSGDVRAAVADDPYAIGYLSFSLLDNSVKALRIDGVEASIGNVKNGNYPYSHRLTAVTPENPEDGAEDFLRFLRSSEGQKIVEEHGYISQSNTGAFQGKKPTGTLKISCADSAEKLMEKLAEGYGRVNDQLKIEITRKNADAALKDAAEKNSLSVLTRPLREKEKSVRDTRLAETVFAEDGIAVVVNPVNTAEDLSVEQVQKIYKGEIKKWSEVIR